MNPLACIALAISAIGCGSNDRRDATPRNDGGRETKDAHALPSFEDAGFATVEIGTGQTRFEPLLDGVPVPLIAGSQGGFHVWLGLRVTGLRGPNLFTQVETRQVASSGASEGSSGALTFDHLDGGMLQLYGWPAVLDTTRCPVGEAVRLSVRVGQNNDEFFGGFAPGTPIATDEREVIVDGSEAAWLPASCLEGGTP